MSSSDPPDDEDEGKKPGRWGRSWMNGFRKISGFGKGDEKPRGMGSDRFGAGAKTPRGMSGNSEPRQAKGMGGAKFIEDRKRQGLSGAGKTRAEPDSPMLTRKKADLKRAAATKEKHKKWQTKRDFAKKKLTATQREERFRDEQRRQGQIDKAKRHNMTAAQRSALGQKKDAEQRARLQKGMAEARAKGVFGGLKQRFQVGQQKRMLEKQRQAHKREIERQQRERMERRRAEERELIKRQQRADKERRAAEQQQLVRKRQAFKVAQSRKKQAQRDQDRRRKEQRALQRAMMEEKMQERKRQEEKRREEQRRQQEKRDQERREQERRNMERKRQEDKWQ